MKGKMKIDKGSYIDERVCLINPSLLRPSFLSTKLLPSRSYLSSRHSKFGLRRTNVLSSQSNIVSSQSLMSSSQSLMSSSRSLMSSSRSLMSSSRSLMSSSQSLMSLSRSLMSLSRSDIRFCRRSLTSSRNTYKHQPLNKRTTHHGHKHIRVHVSFTHHDRQQRSPEDTLLSDVVEDLERFPDCR